jgi:hypothetical protein
MGVGVRPKFNRAGAKHLRARFQLDVHFQTDGGDVFHLSGFSSA